MTRARALWLLAALTLAAPAGAQRARPPELAEVQRRVEADRYADARAELRRWWEEAGEKAGGAERATGLYLRAVLADSLEAAERDLLRVTIEHPLASEADDALLRLGHARLARRDTLGAQIHFARLVREYPQSPLRPVAHRALASLGLVPESAAPSSAAAPPQASPPSRPPPRAADAPAVDRFTVEVASERSIARASETATALRARGFDAFLVIVGEGSTVRVRVGGFPTRAAADAVVASLRKAGFRGKVVPVDG